MTAGVIIRSGLSPAHRSRAAWLYWKAFGSKLGRVLGPEDRALRFLETIIRADHALSALSPDGALLGVAGFKTSKGAFAGGDFADLRRGYGLAGALWRAGLLELLERDVESARFLMDGICVAPEARGQGVGSALLEAICDEAARRGYPAVRLDVVDTNPRARALYERIGFEAVEDQKMGALGWVFGFASATVMVRQIGAGAA